MVGYWGPWLRTRTVTGSVTRTVMGLAQQVPRVTGAALPSAAAATPSAAAATRCSIGDLYICNPGAFEGNLDKCRGRLVPCRLVCEQRPLSFATDSARVHVLIGILRGKALIRSWKIILKWCSTTQTTLAPPPTVCLCVIRKLIRWPRMWSTSGPWESMLGGTSQPCRELFVRGWALRSTVRSPSDLDLAT